MDARVKGLWVKALRSGEYEQGKQALHPNGKFCCLGVLCDLYLKETGNGEWEENGMFRVNKYDYNDAELPEAVMEWAGLDDPNPTLGTHKNARTAATLNDRNETFYYIATRIEKAL